MYYICVQLYAYVTVTCVYECHMSILTRMQTIWNLHILENCKGISIQSDCVDRTWRLIRIYTVCPHFVPYHFKWCKAWLSVIIAIWWLILVYTTLMLLILFILFYFISFFLFIFVMTRLIYERMYTYSRFSEQKIMSVKVISVPVTIFTPHTDTDPNMPQLQLAWRSLQEGKKNITTLQNWYLQLEVSVIGF